MKLTQIKSIKTNSEDLNTGGFFLLLSVVVILSFTVFLWRADHFSQKRIDNGKVQETVGDRIQALGRFDQERQTRLQQQWDNTVRQFTVFTNSREGRLQEILGQSIVGMTQTILMEQNRLRGAVVRAQKDLRLFNEGRDARWQEKLCGAVMKAYRRAPEGGVAFQLTFERETIRLGKLEARTTRNLQSTLGALMAQEARFHMAIPGMYRDAIESAQRSAQLLEASYMASTGRILDGLKTDLSWQRRPEDYTRLIGVVQEVLRNHRGAGGFVEYGWPALTGLLVAMVWMGLTIPKGPSADVDAAKEEMAIDLSMPKAA
ncbi:MAG: hypothetical protein HY283_04975 [Nitrospirae bacterium]|nr:hypothetical protein [Nitrospirota bacterium]